MATQEKQYIELTDILALRCDCKLNSKDPISGERTSELCGASLSVPLEGDAARSLLTCPRCNGPWAGPLDGANARAIRAFEQALAGLKGNFNCRLFLEIASDPAADDPRKSLESGPRAR